MVRHGIVWYYHCGLGESHRAPIFYSVLFNSIFLIFLIIFPDDKKCSLTVSNSHHFVGVFEDSDILIFDHWNS